MRKPTTKEIARFFDKVQITKHCWLWTAALRCGYGHFGFDKGTIVAHRFSYALFVRPIESGKQILHRRECGNRNCVNPHHLYMGTHADNIRDRIIWGKSLAGEAHGNSKLSEKDVLDIRRIHKDKRSGYKNTANLFGISAAQVGRIVLGRSWTYSTMLNGRH